MIIYHKTEGYYKIFVLNHIRVSKELQENYALPCIIFEVWKVNETKIGIFEEKNARFGD